MIGAERRSILDLDNRHGEIAGEARGNVADVVVMLDVVALNHDETQFAFLWRGGQKPPRRVEIAWTNADRNDRRAAFDTGNISHKT